MINKDDDDVKKHVTAILMADFKICELSKYITSLSEAEKNVDKKLKTEVETNCMRLLNNIRFIENLSGPIDIAEIKSSSLMLFVQKARDRISLPYIVMQKLNQKLKRSLETYNILTRIAEFVHLNNELLLQLSNCGPNEMIKSAQIISQINEILNPDNEMNLYSIQSIEENVKRYRRASKAIERNAEVMLQSGAVTKNQKLISIALQVYFNLNVLPTKVEQIILDEIENLKSALDKALDAKKINEIISSSQIPNSSAIANNSNVHMAGSVLPGFRSQLWNNVENVLDFIYNKNCELMQLQKVLCKKRDPTVGATFAELLNQDDGKQHLTSVLSYFWPESLKVIKNSFVKGSSSSSSIRQTLEGEFPKLVKLFNDLWQRLCAAANSCLVSDPTITIRNPFHSKSSDDLRNILTDFERVYLSRSISRLFDPVNLMFASSKVSRRSIVNSTTETASSNVAWPTPSSEELGPIVRVIASELSIACKVNDSNNRLWTAVAKNVAKTVRLMCNKCEESMASSDDNEETSQVVGYPTDGQRKNVKVVNCINAFHKSIEKIAKDQADAGNVEAREIMVASLKDIDKLSQSVIDPLIESINDAIEAIILTMHNEAHFANEDDLVATKVSPYLRELKNFLHRSCSDFLQPFQCQQNISKCTLPVTVKTIHLFVQHASMIRPLGRFGQRSIAFDCDQFDTVIEPLIELVQRSKNVQLMEDVEKALKEVTAFKTLLFTKPEFMLDMEEVKNGSLKYSIVLHFLFNKAPSELKSPNESAGWSISRYSRWLEDHKDENDRLQLIKGALESYAAGTRLRREKSYVAPYPIMIQLLQEALNYNSKA